MTRRLLVLVLGALALPAAISAAELSIVGNGANFDWTEPLTPGGLVWFDVIISNPMGESTEAAQVTLELAPFGHGGSLAFSAVSSTAVASDASYWILGNSAGANALDLGPSRYQFGDNPDNPPSAQLEHNDIVARFAFTWDGTVGQYSITPDTSTQFTFLLQNFSSVAPTWASSPVTLWVPEPGSAALLALAALLGVRRRA